MEFKWSSSSCEVQEVENRVVVRRVEAIKPRGFTEDLWRHFNLARRTFVRKAAFTDEPERFSRDSGVLTKLDLLFLDGDLGDRSPRELDKLIQ